MVEAAEVKRPFRVVKVKVKESDISGNAEEKSFFQKMFGME